MTQGCFALVLHTHIPYVLSHGTWPHGSEWLCEAAAESYLPLLRKLNGLIENNTRFRLTFSLSPVLCEQLADPSFKNELTEYLRRKADSARHDLETFHRFDQSELVPTAELWIRYFEEQVEYFETIQRDIPAAFRGMAESGHIEIITCGATHGYYPLLSRDESLRAQTMLAVQSHKKYFGRAPNGMWLPECGYRPGYRWTAPVALDGEYLSYDRPGVEDILAECNLGYFIVDYFNQSAGSPVAGYFDRFEKLRHRARTTRSTATMPRNVSPREVHRPEGRHTSDAPVAFIRDPETSVKVWSGEYGYPGDGAYLEFHKKRFPGGHRYWSVTSPRADLGEKDPYVRRNAESRITEHAADFVNNVRASVQNHFTVYGRPGVVVSPYDTELFGHWWFEGIDFLAEVLRLLAEDPKVSACTLSEYLEAGPDARLFAIPECSWGLGGGHTTWLNQDTTWTWERIYRAEADMCRLAGRRRRLQSSNSALDTLLAQMARELLLLSSSDWQFLISAGTARDYAENRVRCHAEAFFDLKHMAESLFDGIPLTKSQMHALSEYCARDRIFENIDPLLFAPR